MTTIDLYRKHKAGEISREKFLYEVRRDNKLPFITNLTSYDDAVKILKNKGIVTEVDTKEAKATEAVKAEVKPKKATESKLKELHIDQANPYEYRHGLAHELNQLDDYSAEALEKAKTTVLKNLAKNANFYSNLLNQQQSHYEFKLPESQDKGAENKLRPDGRLKKEVKKDEKANVKDNLGKKEAGKLKPKGVKIMPDKGVTGSSKTIKEGLLKESKYISTEEIDGETFPSLNKKAIADYLKSVIDPSEIKSVNAFMRDEEGFDESASYFFDTPDVPEDEDGVNIPDSQVEDWAKQEMSYYLFSSPDEFPGKENMEEGSFMGGTDLGSSSDQVEQKLINALKTHDWYYQYSDDSRWYNAGRDEAMEISSLMKQLPRERAVELYNMYCPKGYQITNEDKVSKIKEALKKALKEEDPQLKPISSNIEKKETELANLYTQKANILKKPGTQS